jgi:hypothetical protein
VQAALAAQAETRDRIALEGVDPERDDEGVGPEGRDRAQPGLQCLTPGREAGAARQRQVEIEARTGAGAAFVRVAEEERVLAARVPVDRQHRRIRARARAPAW